MDTTTQYKLNKYSKKVNDAYKQNNMSKVNEYMQHQFNYINKYAQQQQQQQHGGGLEEIRALLASIVESVSKLNEEIRKYNEYIGVINELKQKIAQLEAQLKQLESS
jgi:hypothetical protein